MWDSFKQFAENFLNPVGIVVGLIAAIPVFWTWWEVVFGARWRRREWFRQARRHTGERAAILVVDFLPGKDIAAAVERARNNIPELKDIPDSRVFRKSTEQPLTPDNMPEIHGLIRSAARDVLSAGADVVHLFYAGPAIGAAVLGAELANGARVLLYQHNQGQYENFGPLREPRSRL
jgi:hypothetical protein